MELVIAIIGAIIGGFFGGWAGAFFQFQKSKKADKAAFLWQFRLKIFEADQAMWQAKNYMELMVPINWLCTAVDDPRVKIESKFVEIFIANLEKGWRCWYEEKQLTGNEHVGIDTDIVEKVKESRIELDKQIIKRMKQLKID